MPWVFEDEFNSDTKSIGDLNGQDGWSGGATYDVTTEDTYDGDQAIKAVNANQNVDNTFAALSDGVMYVAMKCTAITGGGVGDASFQLKSGASVYSTIQFRSDGSPNANVLTVNNDTSKKIVDPFSTSQWYVVEITIISTSSFSVRVYNGTSWSSSFGPYSPLNNGVVDGCRFSGGTSQTIFYDTITPTDPTAVTLTINLFDSVTITENIVLSIPMWPSVFDSVTITESVNVLIPTLHVSPFDSVTVAENIKLSYSLPSSIFDSTTVTEEVQISLSLPSPIFDSITVTEGVQISLSLPSPIFDSVTVTENLQIVHTYNVKNPIEVWGLKII